jgi:nitroreductase
MLEKWVGLTFSFFLAMGLLQVRVGHVGQNLFLQAEALGLGAGIVGAFNDLEVSKVAGLPPKHEPLLMMPVGYKK